MSKDSNPRGWSRILKLSLDAAFGMAAAPNAVAVKAHREGEAETDETEGSASINDRVSTASRLEVEAVHVVIEEGLKNTERHSCAGKFSQRAACKSGRGRGRKLAEKCSKPGCLLQNGECAASNICESQPDDVHVQIRSHVSIGIAPMADGTAAGKDIAEARCVDIVLLTDNDKQRLTKEGEDTCELPDLVKCQMSTEHVNSTPKHKESNTGIDKQDHSSNSSSIDCSGLNDKTMAVEHLLPPKSLTPESNISSRGKYAHGIQKQGREAAALSATPWKGREMPYYADFYRGKRTGQQFRAYGRNYYTKKELFCSVPSEKHRLNRSSNFLKPPGFQNHGGTYRDNYPRWRNKCTNKQAQDIHNCVSSKDTFKTQAHELNKGDIGRGIKQQEGDTSQAKQLMEDARKAKQQEVNDSKADQQKAGGSSYKQHEKDERTSKYQKANDSKVNQQKTDDSKVNQQNADDSKMNQQKRDDSKVNQQKAVDNKVNQQKTDDSKVNQQKADDSKANQQATDGGRSKQGMNESKSKQSETKASQSKHEVFDRNPQQQGAHNSKAKPEVDAIRSKQQQYDSRLKQQMTDDSKFEQQVGHNEAAQQGDDSKANQHEGDDSEANQHEGDDSKANQHDGDDSKANQHEGDDSEANQHDGDDSKANQHDGDDSEANQHEGDDSEANQHEGDDSKANQHEGDDSEANQHEGDDSEANQHEGDGSKANQHEGDDSEANQHEGDDSKAKQHEGDDSEANQHEGDDSEANQHEGDGSKANQHEGDDSEANQHEGDGSKSNQHEGDGSEANQHEGDGSKANQHEGDDSKANQHEGDGSKANQHEGDDSEANQHEGDDSEANQHEGDGSKANQHEGDGSKANQHEGDDSKATKPKGYNIQSNKQEADSKSKQQKLHMKVNDTSKRFTARPSINLLSEMKNVGNLDSVSRYGEQQNCQLIHDTSKTPTAEAATNRLYQDASEMTERYRLVSVYNKETTPSQNIENFSTENTDNSVTLKARIGAGTVCMQEPVQETSSEFVGCNSSVHTMINAIYQSYEQATVQHDDQPAELPESNAEMQDSTGVECVPGEASEHAQEESTLMCFISSAEKDLVAMGDESSAKEKREGYTSASMGDVSCAKEKREGYTSASVQKRGDNEYVYVKKREVIQSASEEKIEDIVCASKGGRDNGLSASEQEEAIVCQGSTYIAKKKREDNNYVSEGKGELHACTSGEKGDMSSFEQKGEVVISVSEQKEVKMSASEVMGNKLRNDHDMVVNKMNYETAKINQDLENDLQPASIISQEIPLPPCHLSASSSQFYADLPTTVGSEHSRLCETVLSQNPLNESSTDHCTPRAPKVLPSQQIMVGQPGHSRSNVPDNFHQHISCYDISTLPGSYSGSASTGRTPRAPKVLPSQQIMVGQPGHSRSNVPDNFHQHISCYGISTHPGSYSGSATSVKTSEGKQNSSAFAPSFHTRELSLPAETLGSEAAMDRMMTFLRSCSTNILQHTSQYNDNHPLDVTIAVSLTHPPLSDCAPRLPHRHDNPCLEDRSRSPCPPPVCPYPGWVPAHPSYWSWWPWFERCSPNLSTPISSAPLYSTCPPSNIHPVSSTDRGPRPSDVSNLPPSESDDSSHGPASTRAYADHICPKMCSCWNPAVFGQKELDRTHTLTVHRWRGYWTPEMEANDPNVNANDPNVNAKVVEDYSVSRLQTSKNVAEEETWNDGHSQVPSRQQAEIDSSLNLHQNHYLLGNLRTDSVALSSRSSEEPVMEEADEQSHFRQNSLRSASLRKPMRNNWTSRMTPPVASTLRKGNDGMSPSTAALTASPDSLFLRRDASGPVTDSTSNFTYRSRGFQPASHFESQAARRKSAPYQMARPWTVAHPQGSQRKSFPSAATISSANRCSNTGKNGQLASETGSSSPSNVAANKKCVKDWALSFVARSRSYNYRFIDCHCHIDFIYSKLEVPKETYFSKFQKEHADTFPANYEGCVAIFCLPSTFSADNPQDDILKTVSMEDGIWLALGCHPKHAVEFTDSHLRGLRHMLKHPKVVALGEIGLDYSGTFRQHSEVQKHVFRQQLQLALELKLPLVIHCRDADDDCLEILTEMVPSDHKIHAHCFTRDIDVAMRWMMPFQNLFLGLTPVVTYKTALDVVNTATFIPLDRLLLETDAPFFVPHGVRMRSSHPGFALFTAERVAELKKISVDEVLKACRENTNKMYGI